MFEKGSWIWASSSPERDEYAEFRENFVFDGSALKLWISADSDYAVYVNGVYAASGQYGDFEYWKIADEIDLTPFCKQGTNALAIGQRYIRINAQRGVSIGIQAEKYVDLFLIHDQIRNFRSDSVFGLGQMHRLCVRIFDRGCE